ncbi:zinc finger protein 568-like isoform X2 [Plectropomus leopardus]|uniref:zinc finger protein 568-like isoform X2 n=1 Tax=Plectropomus leopardus TaxID=160734 RepID=UPI001C4C56E0|nr:zinc finger protein 568-like isoform X2 [Plectropomus leopardus]
MGQIEELKLFVSERLHAAASEILGAIEKSFTDYEERASRLKEENDRHRSLLDIILQAKSPQIQGHATKSYPFAAGSGASDLSPRSEKAKSRARETHYHSRDWQWAFTSRTDFVKFAAGGDCPYCLKKIQATETHLIRKHCLPAVYFNEKGTEKFVVPCTCTDLIQGRSHWHCPYCTKILNRKCNFEMHISKQHGFTILQQNQGTETDQSSVSAFEEGAPLSPETWCPQKFSNVHQEDHQASLLLQVKQEEEQGIRQVSHAEWQNSVQVEVKGEQIQQGNSEIILKVDHAQGSAFTAVCMDGLVQDPSEISLQSGEGHPLPHCLNQPLEKQSDSGVDGIQQTAGESQHSTTHSSSKACNIKTNKGVKKSSSALSKKSSQPFVSQSPTGSHRCKACGKTFHYMYTLRTHVQTHAVDKIRICGICGKHLKPAESLIQHLQSHTKTNKCVICGKQFSNSARLKQHKRFHRPKGLNVMLST